MNPLSPNVIPAKPDTVRPPQPSPPTCPSAERGLVILFLALIAGGLLIQTAVELRRGDGVQAFELFKQKPTSASLRVYERSLEEASLVGRTLRPWFQFAQFAWLQDGGEKALAGRNGWLFYKPGCDDLLARGPSLANSTHDPVAAIVAWRDALAARGIQLLVMPAPNKENVYPDRLTRRVAAGTSVSSPLTSDLLVRLKAAHVECVNLFEVFAETRNSASAEASLLYLAQDSHWSPAGVALAAQVVAKRLVELGWAQPGRTEYNEHRVMVERHGDLIRMLQLPDLERRVGPEKVECFQVVQPGTAQLYQDAPNSAVLILGDSFLRIYEQDEPGSAGFISHLAKELKQPLSSLVSEGGASTLVRQELYRRPALLDHKRVVLWEFVERDLRLGTEGWQNVPLPAPGHSPGIPSGPTSPPL